MRRLAKKNMRSFDSEGNKAIEMYLEANRKELKEGKKLPGAQLR